MTVIGRGNVQMSKRINNTAGATLKSMWMERDKNVIPLMRVCTQHEAINTWFYCLAGGKYCDLAQKKAPESVAVNQVANSESIVNKSSEQERMAKLRAILAQKSGGSTPQIQGIATREVVEYSKHQLNIALNGKLVKVLVNPEFLVKGSNLVTEGDAWILQIGTPLALVEIEEEVRAAGGIDTYGLV